MRSQKPANQECWKRCASKFQVFQIFGWFIVSKLCIVQLFLCILYTQELSIFQKKSMKALWTVLPFGFWFVLLELERLSIPNSSLQTSQIKENPQKTGFRTWFPKIPLFFKIVDSNCSRRRWELPYIHPYWWRSFLDGRDVDRSMMIGVLGVWRGVDRYHNRCQLIS